MSLYRASAKDPDPALSKILAENEMQSGKATGSVVGFLRFAPVPDHAPAPSVRLRGSKEVMVLPLPYVAAKGSPGLGG
jgi:hypothetical protein